MQKSHPPVMEGQLLWFCRLDWYLKSCFFRSLFYRKTLDSILRLRFSPTDTPLHSFLLTAYSSRRAYIPDESLPHGWRTRCGFSRPYPEPMCNPANGTFCSSYCRYTRLSIPDAAFQSAYCPFQQQRKPSFHPTGRRSFHSCPFYRPSR